MSQSQNILDKIWEAHVVQREDDAPDVLFIDLQLLHEVTSPQAFEVLRQRKIGLFDLSRNFATVDHSIPTDTNRANYIDAQAKTQVEALRGNCKEFGVKLFDAGSGAQGIIHVIGPELGLTQPGRTIVCGDSHTSTHGAFGALAFGIGTTQISQVMATQCLLLEKPKSMQVNFIGKPTKKFSAKDAILALINQIGIQGGTGYGIEFAGDYIKNLSMEERMTICNMAIECGARSGLISPDATTFKYLKGRKFAPSNFEEAVEKWESLASEENAKYDTTVTVNLEDLKPFITWGTSPEQSIQIDQTLPIPAEMSDEGKKLAAEKAYEYTKLIPGQKIAGTKIDYVFIGSCTNGRLQDLREAAAVLQSKKVAPGVTAYIVPGSEVIYDQCKKEGLDKIFINAGAQFREPGCSMCLAMNGDAVPAGSRCASTSNRNFVGRQGAGSITHLMSPAMAAMAAVKGGICEL